MGNWTRPRQIDSADSLARVFIMANGQGQFCFSKDAYVTEDGYTFWRPNRESDLYDSAEAAEHAARPELPWLREENSN